MRSRRTASAREGKGRGCSDMSRLPPAIPARGVKRQFFKTGTFLFYIILFIATYPFLLRKRGRFLKKTGGFFIFF